MKVKFTKLAALLLAGAALFATGCTDYEVDIQKVDEKVNALTSEVNNNIAGIQQQIAGLNATVATLETQAKHDKDIAALNKTITDLETALKADYEKKINDAVNVLNASLADLRTQMTTELDKKVDKTAFDAAKEEVEKAILAANQKIQALEDADADFKEQIANLTKQFTAALEGLDAKITALDEKKADKTEVAALETKLEGEIAAAKTELETKITDLETALNAEITGLKTELATAQAAIKKINEEDLPAIRTQISALEQFQKDAEQQIKDLQEGKLDKADFDTYYKAAYEKYTKGTIELLQAAIDDLAATTVKLEDYNKDKAAFEEALKQIVANFANYVTLEEYNKKVEEIMKKFDDYVLNSVFKEECAKIIAMFDDYVLKSDFEDFVKIAATKEEVNALEARINGKLEQLEKDLKKYADDQDDKVKEAMTKYINEQVDKLQAQIDDLVKKDEELEKRIAALEDTVNNKILPEVEFAFGYMPYWNEEDADDDHPYYTENTGLQGYIDDAALKVYYLALEYVNEQLELVWEQIGYIWEEIANIYNDLNYALQRIQSIQYVPDYDDLKITVNMAKMTVPEQEVIFYLDQPTKVTYQFLPAEYAPYIAQQIKDNCIRWYNAGMGAYTRDDLKASGWNDLLIAFFDVKPLNTRDAEVAEDATPKFHIIDIDKVDADSGEITFVVQPENVASAQFEANGIQPEFLYTVDYRPMAFGPVASDYVTENGEYGFNWFGSMLWPAYSREDIDAYRERAAFAAQLRMYVMQLDAPEEESMYINYTDTEYVDIENELASPYNVLYPAVTSEIDVLPDVYKPELDEEGKPKKDEEGDTILVPATPEYQYLPYTALRDDDPVIGEDPNWEGPLGYRIILDQAVPAVEVNGKILTIADAQAKGLVIPNFVLSDEAEFTYRMGKDDFTEVPEENVEKCYKETPEQYAEIELKGDLLDRFGEIGHVVRGTYSVSAPELPDVSFDVFGDVEITKSLGSAEVEATIVWDYDGGYLNDGVMLTDSEVDHENFYNDAQLPYGRSDFEVTIKPNKLEETLDVTLNDFKGLSPKELEIIVTYTEDDGTVVTETLDDTDVAELFPGEYPVKITDDGKLTIDFVGFKWDAVYDITATYELPEALITITGTITTIDRNREPVVLGPYGCTFEIGEPYDEEKGYGYVADEDWYRWESDALFADIFQAFDTDGVINVEDNTDFEYDAQVVAFSQAELINKLAAAADKGTAWGYIDIKNKENTDVYAWTMKSVTTAVLAGDLFNSGVRDENDPNLWLGNEITRNITTYIGEEVQFTFKFNYKVPDYNYLHLGYYTFTDHDFVGKYTEDGIEKDFIVTKLDLPANITDAEYVAKYPWKFDEPLWWSQVNPSYFVDVPDQQAAPQAGRVSNRYALADYDVSYINLAELAFNVVDKNDKIMSDEEVAAAGLTPKFEYTENTVDEDDDLPEVDQVDPTYLIYKSLWIDNTTFYYRTNEHPFIPTRGFLTLTSAGVDFPVATRFEFPKPSVRFETEDLDYRTYAVVRWTPFQKPKAEGYTMVLDENKIYVVPLFKGMELKDRRPNIPEDKSFYVIKDGEWVVGDAAPDANADSGTNGYIEGVPANVAYHIVPKFDISKVNLPDNLKRLLKIKYSDDGGVTLYDEQNDDETLTPYVYYDYTSETTFHGVVTIPVRVRLENPWQEPVEFAYNFVIKGYGD